MDEYDILAFARIMGFDMMVRYKNFFVQADKVIVVQKNMDDITFTCRIVFHSKTCVEFSFSQISYRFVPLNVRQDEFLDFIVLILEYFNEEEIFKITITGILDFKRFDVLRNKKSVYLEQVVFDKQFEEFCKQYNGRLKVSRLVYRKEELSRIIALENNKENIQFSSLLIRP